MYYMKDAGTQNRHFKTTSHFSTYCCYRTLQTAWREMNYHVFSCSVLAQYRDQDRIQDNTRHRDTRVRVSTFIHSAALSDVFPQGTLFTF